MSNWRSVATILCGLLLPLAASALARAAENDYPTAARADYVLGCMAANGNTREALLKCSCAIDTIAQMMPYSACKKVAGSAVGSAYFAIRLRSRRSLRSCDRPRRRPICSADNALGGPLEASRLAYGYG